MNKETWLKLYESGCWWFAFVGAFLLSLDLVYEQTLLTWKEGSQMVGFSLFHTVGIFLIPSVLLAYLWVLAAPIFFWVGRSMASHTIRLLIKVVLMCIVLALPYIPYSTWKIVTIRMRGPGAHGAEFLVEAAADGDAQFVKRLTSNAINVDAANGDGFTALNAASITGHTDIVSYLLAKGANPDKQVGPKKTSVLMNAIEDGHTESVDLLLQSGADPNLADSQGNTALTVAEKAHNDTLVQKLKAAGRH